MASYKRQTLTMAKRGLARLTADHPVCCFCGGVRQTTSADHQPARVFFRSKRMPDGFVFPACTDCQGVSRQAEAALSLLLVPRERAARDREELRGRAAFYHRNDPGLIEGLWLTRQQKREVMRKLGIKKPAGALLDDLPVIKLPVERWKPHLDILALKLILALHYKYVGQPLSCDGGVYVSFMFNAQLGDGNLLREFEEAALNLESPRHGNEDLGDQVQVRWSVDVVHRSGVFLIHLHGILFVFGITADDPEWRAALEEEGAEDVRGPFDWGGA